MLRALSIRMRLYTLGATLILGLSCLVGLIVTQSAKLQELANKREGIIETIALTESATRTFGDLKYWVTDHAVGLLMHSEREAKEAAQVFDSELSNLEPSWPRLIAVMR